MQVRKTLKIVFFSFLVIISIISSINYILNYQASKRSIFPTSLNFFTLFRQIDLNNLKIILKTDILFGINEGNFIFKNIKGDFIFKENVLKFSAKDLETIIYFDNKDILKATFFLDNFSYKGVKFSNIKFKLYFKKPLSIEQFLNFLNSNFSLEKLKGVVFGFDELKFNNFAISNFDQILFFSKDIFLKTSIDLISLNNKDIIKDISSYGVIKNSKKVFFDLKYDHKNKDLIFSNNQNIRNLVEFYNFYLLFIKKLIFYSQD